MPSVLARAAILLTALLFSTGGAAIKAVSLTSWQIASLRSGVAAAVLLLAVRKLPRLTAPTALVGAAYAATLVTFVTANTLTTAANAVFLQAAAPLYIALLAPWLLGEHLRRRDLPVLAAIAAGMALLVAGSGAPTVTAPNRALGNAVGLVSGVCWSLTVMGLRWIAKRDPHAGGIAAGSAALTGNIIACLATLPLALPLHAVAPRDAAGIAYLGLFQVGLAYVLLTRAIRHVPAVDASLLLLLEPALSPLWAWLLHREAPGFWPLLGGACILGATVRKTWREAKASLDGGT